MAEHLGAWRKRLAVAIEHDPSLCHALSTLAGLSPARLPAAPPAVAPLSGQGRDHASILAMTGTFKVSFDMRETVPFVAGYTPYPPKQLGGHEVVRAIVDTPDHIVLQHLLVVEGQAGKPVVVEHWRQDWTWRPASLLVYVAPGRWTLRRVSEADRRGAWSPTAAR